MTSRVGEWLCAPDVDTEIWRAYERFMTADEAIAAGRTALKALKANREAWEVEDIMGSIYDDYEEIPDTFAIGRCYSPYTCIDPDYVIETLQEQVCEQCGEAGDSFLEALPKPVVDELGDRLNAVLQEWMNKHDLQPTCYYLDEVQEIKLEENE